MTNPAELTAWLAKNRTRATAMALSILAHIGFVAFGVQTRYALQPINGELTKLRAAASEVAAFRSGFKTASPEQELLIGAATDSVSVTTSRDDRVAVAQHIAATAEGLGLDGVRVRIARPDTAAAPVRPDLVRTSVAIADYSLSIEGSGAFGAVLTLINQLPASVAVQRITAASTNGRTRYHVGLAVFESTGAPAATPGLGYLAQYSAPVSDSVPVRHSVGDSVVLMSDPFGTQPAPRIAVVHSAMPAGSPRQSRTFAKPKWHVSATLIVGTRRAAIIDDVLLQVGDSLPGGVTLTSVERDRVVLTDSKGTAHTVAVKEGEAED